MKKSALLLCLALLLGVASIRPAYSQDLYAMASYWEVEDADGVWGAGLGFSLPIITEVVRLDTRAFFFEGSDVDNNDELDLLPIDLGLQIHIQPGEMFDPYLLGGATWVEVDSDRLDVDSEVGAYAGAGLEFGINETFKLFGEAVYRMVTLDSESRIGDDDDFEISGITGNAGFRIHF